MTQYVKEKVAKIETPVTAWMLLGMIGIFACAYAFFLAGTIANVVVAKDASAKASALTSSVGELESEFIAVKSTVDLAYAKAEGFSEPKSETIYIAKKGPASLSINR